MTDQSYSLDTKLNNINTAKADLNDTNTTSQSQRDHQDMIDMRGGDEEKKGYKHYFIIGAPVVALAIIVIVIIAAVSGGSDCPDNEIQDADGKCVPCDPFERPQ